MNSPELPSDAAYIPFRDAPNLVVFKAPYDNWVSKFEDEYYEHPEALAFGILQYAFNYCDLVLETTTERAVLLKEVTAGISARIVKMWLAKQQEIGERIEDLKQYPTTALDIYVMAEELSDGKLIGSVPFDKEVEISGLFQELEDAVLDFSRNYLETNPYDPKNPEDVKKRFMETNIFIAEDVRILDYLIRQVEEYCPYLHVPEKRKIIDKEYRKVMLEARKRMGIE